MNPDEQLPKFKKVGDGIAKLRGLVPVFGPLSRTVSNVYGAIALRPRVSDDGRYLADPSGATAFLVADVPPNAFALIRSSYWAIRFGWPAGIP